MKTFSRRDFLKQAGLAAAAGGALGGLPAVSRVYGASAPLQAGEILVRELARNIPVVAQSDVIIIGGSTGAVCAAQAAADRGAKVFLATPYQYLGEDLCATLRIWLEQGENPLSTLGQTLFPSNKNLTFTYTADLASSGVHMDTSPPTLLADGKWSSASTESVQYNGDVTIAVDLGQLCQVDEVDLMVYHKSSTGGNFLCSGYSVTTSTDNAAWSAPVSMTNTAAEQATVTEPALKLPLTLGGVSARYLKLAVKKTTDSTRVLIGEVLVQGTPSGGQSALAYGKPLAIKRALDQALLDAGVTFLYGHAVSDVIVGYDNKPCGVVLAGRAGRMAVLGKVIIDATPRAGVARLAGAAFAAWPAGNYLFKRTTIGAPALVKTGIESSRLINTISVPSIYEYTLEINMPDGSTTSFAAAEQTARDLIYSSSMQYASDTLFMVPPDPMTARQTSTGAWLGAAALNLESLRPAAIDRIYVLGGCAGISREQAAALLRPLALMAVGTRVGDAAATMAAQTAAPTAPRIKGSTAPADATGTTGEGLMGLRPFHIPSGTLTEDTRGLPVLATVDIVVVGGGTGGAAAAIGAAEKGAKTLVLEQLSGLGGVGTLGLICVYFDGNANGFNKRQPWSGSWQPEAKMEWWRTTLRAAGGDIWFGVTGCGAYLDQGRVAGVVVATPEGRGVVLAKVVIDATGSADIAASAGAPCITTSNQELAVQGSGLPSRDLTTNYNNTDFSLIDDTDPLDIWHVFLFTRRKMGSAFDGVQIIDSRERRRIAGEFTVNVPDVLNARTYPDTIAWSNSRFDSHGYMIDSYFELTALSDSALGKPDIPYRCLLVPGLEGLLVIGIGLSVHRDVLPVVRMQRDVQNLGYAAGLAAAMALKSGVTLRNINIRTLQAQIVAAGCHSARIQTDTDSYPLPASRLTTAVTNIGANYSNTVEVQSDSVVQDLAVIMANPATALPLLRTAWTGAATASAKLAYARVLGVLGDATGVQSLIDAVNGASVWDTGVSMFVYASYGGKCLSILDRIVLALGRTRDSSALAPLLAKLTLLNSGSWFSHHRAIALALEQLALRDAADPLATLLNKSGMQGYVIHTVDEATAQVSGFTDTLSRERSLREVFLARALYRCGDKGGLGRKILSDYTTDLRGHIARHAYSVLNSSQNAVHDWTHYE